MKTWALMLIPASCSLALLAGCRGGRTGVSDAARERGATTEQLAGGQLDALPTGRVFVRVLGFSQEAGSSFGSEKHQPGLLYVVDGRQRLTIESEPSLDIRPGQAVFQPSLAHVHANPGTTANDWYFVALWPAEARLSPLVSKAAKLVFDGPDLLSGVLTPAPYDETLSAVSLAPGGRTWSHKLGGIEATLVLDGSVTIKRAGQAPEQLNSGMASFTPADTPIQEINNGSAPARFLTFRVTPAGRPFQTNLDEAP